SPIRALGRVTRHRRTARRPTTIAQQIRHANQLGPGLRAQLLGKPSLITCERLEGAAPVTGPRSRLHDPANSLFGERVELLQPRRMALHSREVADAPGGIHLAHEAIADLGTQARAILVLPLLERSGRRDFKAVEEGSADLRVAGAQVTDVGVNPAGRQTYRRALDHDRLARNLGFDDGEPLSKGMIRVLRRRVRPQKIGEIISREALPGLQRKPDEEREMLARAEAHLLASDGEQGRTTQAMQHEMMNHMRTRLIDSLYRLG